MTKTNKQDWEKEFDEVWWKLMGSGEEQAILWLKDFIRSVRQQAREEVVEEIKSICKEMGYGKNGEEHPVTRELLAKLK